MNKILLLFFICVSSVISISLHAQHAIESSPSEFQIMNDYEIAAGKMSDSKYMFKLTTPGGNLQSIRLGVEYKVAKSFSLGAYINGSSFNSIVAQNTIPTTFDSIDIFVPVPVQTFEIVKTYQLEASLEGRYYINQESLIDQGYGNNLNGIYAVAGIQTLLYNSLLNEVKYTPYLGVGIQSRVLKYGLLDFSLLAQVEDNRFVIAPELKVGFAFSKDYKLLELENARCNILRCFEERKYQIKVPVNGLLFLSYAPDLNYVGMSLRPRIEIEHRLAKGWSMNHSFSGSAFFNLNLPREVQSNISQANIGYGNNIRYYFLKKRNIAKGKSADNLSGVYAATSVFVGRNFASFFPENELMQHSNSFYGGLDLGYQARLFKKFYFDCNAFIGRTKVTSLSNIPNVLSTEGFNTRYGVNFEFGVLL